MKRTSYKQRYRGKPGREDLKLTLVEVRQNDDGGFMSQIRTGVVASWGTEYLQVRTRNRGKWRYAMITAHREEMWDSRLLAFKSRRKHGARIVVLRLRGDGISMLHSEVSVVSDNSGAHAYTLGNQDHYLVLTVPPDCTVTVPDDDGGKHVLATSKRGYLSYGFTPKAVAI